ncbi:threonine--tRNA ligase [Virgibacillus halophilus]|uniref:threonine--tRNA ligase n=1 Tax=Tigheibacillus halophilus TaxID=361280 RepID=UPI00363B16BB
MRQADLIGVQFPDGQVNAYTKGISVKDIASDISFRLEKKAVAGRVNGELVDMAHQLQQDAKLEIFTLDSDEGVQVLRHTLASVLAQALNRLYPEAQLGTDAVAGNGFYVDVKLEEHIKPDDLAAITKEMHAIIQENLEVPRISIAHKDAKIRFADREEHLKLEILNELDEKQPLILYQQGEFIDLGGSPCLPRTGMIPKAFQLTDISGAYWKGDSQNEMLQRIYGLAFVKNQALLDYLHFIEEAKKRDHRLLGKQLDLFMFSEEAPGMPFYLPKGQIIRNELASFSREMFTKDGYEEVRTPLMMNQRLWEESGHWDHYHENMYFTKIDNEDFALKPMNCPGHMLIFKNKLRSYRDLPIRLAEFGQVHRHEFSGALNGMLRVRTFCQDDAHIFVHKNQIELEIKEVFRQVDAMYQTFGFSYSVELSTRPKDSMGEDHLWEMSEQALKKVLDELQIAYQINAGDGAFYGPKIDFHIQDALKRSHQCATIQLDFQMPEKFDLTYVNENNVKVRPVVIHRAIFGSIDRFLGILVEHFAGAFPVWLAPVQVKVIPIAAVHHTYCIGLKRKLETLGIRVALNDRDEKLGYKMREAQTQKIPYTLVIGDKEIADQTVNVRRFGKKQSESLAAVDFQESI